MILKEYGKWRNIHSIKSMNILNEKQECVVFKQSLLSIAPSSSKIRKLNLDFVSQEQMASSATASRWRAFF